MRATTVAALGTALLATLSVSVAALGTSGRADSQPLVSASPAEGTTLAVSGGQWGCVQGQQDGLNVNGTGPVEKRLIVWYCTANGQDRKKAAEVMSDADGRWKTGLLLTAVQAQQNGEPPRKYLKVCQPGVIQQPPDGCSQPWEIVAQPPVDPCP